MLPGWDETAALAGTNDKKQKEQLKE